MELLIVRHGEAVDDAPGLGDAGRYLTAKGRRVSRRVAGYLRDHACPVTIWTSPLVRAVQTAEIMAEACALEDDVLVVRDLASAGDVQSLLRQVAVYRGRGPLALVGHEPHLSELVTTLADHKDHWPGFKKSGVAALEWEGSGKAAFRWLLVPKEMKLVRDLTQLAKE